MDLHAWITQQVDTVERLIDENEWPPSQADGVRLRCEADRRILARHALDQAAADTDRAAACDGCGVEWVQDYCDPITANLNDCPELLDLAHAHGLTDETLARLDRPQPPERMPHPGGFAGMLRDSFDRALALPITTSDVPEALRGPRWKP